MGSWFVRLLSVEQLHLPLGDVFLCPNHENVALTDMQEVWYFDALFSEQKLPSDISDKSLYWVSFHKMTGGRLSSGIPNIIMQPGQRYVALPYLGSDDRFLLTNEAIIIGEDLSNVQAENVDFTFVHVIADSLFVGANLENATFGDFV